MNHEQDHRGERRRYASSTADGGIIHEVTEIIDYASPHAYYLARCAAKVPCRSADVFKDRDVPGLLCAACRRAQQADAADPS